MTDLLREIAEIQETALKAVDSERAGIDTTEFALTPVDWAALERDGFPEIRWLRRPDLPAAARIWATGPASSGKSFWALWQAAELSRQGIRVAFISQENPLAEDARRVKLLDPDLDCLKFFHDAELDLLKLSHVDELVRVAAEVELAVLDTLTAVWSGDENDNAAIAAFDRNVLSRVVRETGSSVMVLDHTGHPQAFVRRRGVSAARGASSKGQKADVVLTFKPEGSDGFVLEQAKNRLGLAATPRTYRIVDTEDGHVTFEEHERRVDEVVIALADAMVEAIEKAGALSTNQLRDAVGGGRDRQTDALRRLSEENPPRVVSGMEIVQTTKGQQRGKIWRPAREDEQLWGA